ncbi:MAG: type II toxin-antitoxin system VapC family toxin [Candidatus Hydrothermarchaeota archaeon]
MAKRKVYLDTSVISAYLDEKHPERMQLTREAWDIITTYGVYISTVNIREINDNPSRDLRRKMMNSIERFDVLELNEESVRLANIYIKHGIFPERFRDDALHVAVATVNDMDYLLSWNFRHIIKLRTKRMVNLVNLTSGYKEVEIITPPEL